MRVPYDRNDQTSLRLGGEPEVHLRKPHDLVAGAAIGFDDDFIYRELDKPSAERALVLVNIMRDDALEVFAEWARKPDKIEY